MLSGTAISVFAMKDLMLLAYSVFVTELFWATDVIVVPTVPILNGVSVPADVKTDTLSTVAKNAYQTKSEVTLLILVMLLHSMTFNKGDVYLAQQDV